jgi:CRP-like cAMP-binding protein
MPQPIAVLTPTPCKDCPLRRRDVFRDRSPSDVAFIQEFKTSEVFYQPNQTILFGWAFRFKTLEDGRRQIINYVLPGDLMGLQASLSAPMTHGVDTLTECVLCVFQRGKLWDLFSGHPQLGFDVTWLAAREESTLDEFLLSIGRRTALERLAYLLWFLFDKAKGIGLVKNNRLEMPMRQGHLADTLGLSLVHTNKTLQKLRKEQSIHLDDRSLTIIDEEALMRLARVENKVSNSRPLI